MQYNTLVLHATSINFVDLARLQKMSEVTDSYVNRGGITVTTIRFPFKYKGAVECLLNTLEIPYV